MSHECPECGVVCGCNMDDYDQPHPGYCTHQCQPDEFEDDDFYYHEWWEDENINNQGGKR